MRSGMWIFMAVVGREQPWCGMRWPFCPCLLVTVVWPSIFFASG